MKRFLIRQTYKLGIKLLLWSYRLRKFPFAKKHKKSIIWKKK